MRPYYMRQRPTSPILVLFCMGIEAKKVRL